MYTLTSLIIRLDGVTIVNMKANFSLIKFIVISLCVSEFWFVCFINFVLYIAEETKFTVSKTSLIIYNLELHSLPRTISGFSNIMRLWECYKKHYTGII